MKIITFVLALLLFLFVGFLVGFGCAAVAHASIMRGLTYGYAFTVDGKRYRAIEVDQ